MSTLKVTIVQPHIEYQDVSHNLNHVEGIIHGIDPAETDLVILPEMFATGFTTNPGFAEDCSVGADTGPILSKLNEWAHEHPSGKKLDIIAGVFVKEMPAGSEDFIYTNTERWINIDAGYLWMVRKMEGGPLAGFSGSSSTGPDSYDKRHLFPIPMPGEEAEDHALTPGDEIKIFTKKEGTIRIMPSICYDLRFPAWLRNRNFSLLEGGIPFEHYEILICIANWPFIRQDAWHHLLKARAIENQAFVIGVNCVGIFNEIEFKGGSCVYGPGGEEITLLGESEDTRTVELNMSQITSVRSNMPFLQHVDRYNISM